MLLTVDQVYKSFQQKTIINGVSLQLACGECLGIIGESGSGKSTLGKMMLGIEPPSAGQILFEEADIYQSGLAKKSSNWRRKISAVFQDYTSSVNPRFRVKDIIAEPMENSSKAEIKERVVSLLEKVGLCGDHIMRYPHELSGGQLQRVCIARAISMNPAFILLDEPVSSLDVSVQVQVMDLLLSLKEEYNLSYVFISHDLAAVAYFCDRALFFAEGKIVEEVPHMMELGNIQNAYSRKLLHSVMDFSDVLNGSTG